MLNEINASEFDVDNTLKYISDAWDNLYKGKPNALAIKIVHLQVMTSVLETLKELPLSGKIKLNSYNGGQIRVAVKGKGQIAVALMIQTVYEHGGDSISFAANSHGKWGVKNPARSFRFWHKPERIHAKVRGMILSKVKFLQGDDYMGPSIG